MSASVLRDCQSGSHPRAPAADRTSITAGERLRIVDLLRGLVIVLMVLDHARDLFHASGYAFDPLDPIQTTPVLYVTRWVTHFCAPTFVFLCGVSAWLQQASGKPAGVLSGFLLKRGLWLVLLDVTAISFALSFSLPYLPFLQVLWAIGWGMACLAAVMWAPRRIVLVLGVVITAGHNLLDPLTPAQFGLLAPLWTFLHEGGLWSAGPTPVALVLYPVLPWFGLMCIGYGLGPIFLSARRDWLLAGIGAGLTVGFLALRAANIYGDPEPWTVGGTMVETAMRFMDVEKYPPSLLYVCATLGPMLLITPLLNRLGGPFGRILGVLGATSLFAYVIHFFMLHTLSIAAHAMAGRPVAGLFDYIRKIVVEPESLSSVGLPLWVTFAAWIIVLATLYPCCLWWKGVKARRKDWWMAYL